MIAWISLLLVPVLVFVVSALPLYFSIKLLGGKAGFIRIFIVNALVAFLAFLIKLFFHSWSGLLAFVAMIWVYHKWFHLGWVKSLIAWILQFVFAVLVLIILVVIFGVSVAL